MKQTKKCNIGHADCMCYCIDSKESWQERFEEIKKEFISLMENGRKDGLYVLDMNLFKSFIQQELDNQKKEIVEKIRELRNKRLQIIKNEFETNVVTIGGDLYLEAIDDLINEIK